MANNDPIQSQVFERSTLIRINCSPFFGITFEIFSLRSIPRILLSCFASMVTGPQRLPATGSPASSKAAASKAAATAGAAPTAE